MTKKEIHITAMLLRMASDEFSNHGCNDLPSYFWDGWTKEERQKLVKEYYTWNRSPKDYDPNHLEISDSSLMSFLADKLSFEV